MTKDQYAVVRVAGPDRETPTRSYAGRGDPTAPSSVPRIVPADLDAFLTPPSNDVLEDRTEPAGVGRVLILVSDLAFRTVLGHSLMAAGFVVQLSNEWADGVDDVQRFVPDVVVLDSKAPGFLGTQIVQRLRSREKEGHRSAVITLIRTDLDIDPSLGLEFHPCDFVLLPVSVRDLALRIDGIVRARRGRHASHPDRRRRYVVGPLEVDLDGHHVLVNGLDVRVSTLEMRLLSYLIEHHGRVRTRKELLQEVWGYNSNVTTRTPDTHVNRLRTKLGPAGALVETVRGTGYRLSGDYPVIIKD